MLILLWRCRFNLFYDGRLNPQIPFNSGSLAISSYATLWLISKMRVNSKGKLVPVPLWRTTWILPVRQESKLWATWLNILGMDKLFCCDFANCWLIYLLSVRVGLFRLKYPSKTFIANSWWSDLVPLHYNTLLQIISVLGLKWHFCNTLICWFLL